MHNRNTQARNLGGYKCRVNRLCGGRSFFPPLNQQNLAKAGHREYRECSKAGKFPTKKTSSKLAPVWRNLGFELDRGGKYVSWPGMNSHQQIPFKCEFKYKWICLGAGKSIKGEVKTWAEKDNLETSPVYHERHSRTGPNNWGMNSIRREVCAAKTFDKL